MQPDINHSEFLTGGECLCQKCKRSWVSWSLYPKPVFEAYQHDFTQQFVKYFNTFLATQCKRRCFVILILEGDENALWRLARQRNTDKYHCNTKNTKEQSIFNQGYHFIYEFVQFPTFQWFSILRFSIQHEELRGKACQRGGCRIWRPCFLPYQKNPNIL